MGWDARFSAEAGRATASEIRELLKIVSAPGVLSFAGGVPDPGLFPLDAASRIRHEIEADATLQRQAMQYAPTEGYEPLRQRIAATAIAGGPTLDPANILVTSGAQQSLTLLAAALIDPGTALAVEDPSYLGALQVFGNRGARFLTLAMDEDGLQPEALEAAFRAGAQLLYTIPDFQNPTGVTLSEERRTKLVELAHRYGVPVIEDIAYRDLYFDAPPPPSLLEIEVAGLGTDGWQRDGLVLQVGTASKVLMPALRVGWTIAPRLLIDKLVLLKQANDLHSSTVNQVIVERLTAAIQPDHTETLRRAYGGRRRAMVDALRRHMPNSARFTEPGGGMFVWVTLQEGSDARRLLETGLAEDKIAFVPGSASFANGGGENTLRLSFATCDEAEITDGMSRLGRLIGRAMTQ